MTPTQRTILRLRPWLLLGIGVVILITIAGLVFAQTLGNPDRSGLVELLVAQLVAAAGLALLPRAINAKTKNRNG